MGKKKVIKQTEEELLKEGEKSKPAASKELKTEASLARVEEGRVYIASSYNNTIITLADAKGNVLAWASAGSLGFKGTKKATPFAASKIAEAIFQIIQKMGIKKLSIFVKGIGGGRESAIRSFAAKGLEIISVSDVTPVPHDGPRARKVRRV